MLKLYGGARSRASIVQWYLEELEIPYEYVMLDMQSGEHRQADYLAINPMGRVPAIADGDFKLWESGAILLYLAEKYDHPVSTERRAEYAQWILFVNATLGPGLLTESSRDREMPRLMPPLNEILERSPFIVGEQFSVADVAVGSTLAYIHLFLKLSWQDYPAVETYLKRLGERPAYEKTIGIKYA
jgi:glutathione S-transferase